MLQARDGCDRRARRCRSRSTPTTSGAPSSAATCIAGRPIHRSAGIYVYADYCSGTIWAIDAADPGTPAVVSETGRTVGSFGEDEAGEVYLADLGSGEILRLAPGD